VAPKKSEGKAKMETGPKYKKLSDIKDPIEW